MNESSVLIPILRVVIALMVNIGPQLLIQCKSVKVAALDRQHPGDLSDIRKMFEKPGYSEDIHKGFIFCLLSSKRPFHEILRPGFLNQKSVHERQFNGMTDEEFTYDMFEYERVRIQSRVIESFSRDDKILLKSFAEGEPIWPDVDLSIYPGIRWKLMNIRNLKVVNKSKYLKQLKQLEEILSY